MKKSCYLIALAFCLSFLTSCEQNVDYYKNCGIFKDSLVCPLQTSISSMDDENLITAYDNMLKTHSRSNTATVDIENRKNFIKALYTKWPRITKAIACCCNGRLRNHRT